MKAQRFGSAHTEKKLQLVAHYLAGFTTALKNQPFKKIYVDAFAGTGTWAKRQDPSYQPDFFDVSTIADGSAMRAMRVEPPFDAYRFVEVDPQKASVLKRRIIQDFPARSGRTQVLTRDANEALQEICRETNWRTSRAVVFLDPFGFQVQWETIQALARTQAVDLWYLVPTGIGINRQISREGAILPAGRRIDVMLGTAEWRTRLVTTETSERDLFGETETRRYKAGGIDQIAELVLERMREIFRGGVARYGLPLGTQGLAMYTLVFACANPTRRASELALRLANAVLKT